MIKSMTKKVPQGKTAPAMTKVQKSTYMPMGNSGAKKGQAMPMASSKAYNVATKAKGAKLPPRLGGFGV